MENNNYYSVLIASLKDLFIQFNDNPYDYFYEEDVRVDLAQKLMHYIKPIEFIHFKRSIRTIPIKCEYPSSLASKQRHDLVFVEPNSLSNIYNLDIPIAIELKLGSKSYDRCSEFKEDIKKFLGYTLDNFIGICIYFYQDEIDLILFEKWFEDIVEKFEKIDAENITIDISAVNSFIVTPNKSILKAISYKNC